MRYIVITFWCVFLVACQPREVADVIYYGGTIYTMNDAQAKAAFVATRGNKIVFVGSPEDSLRWIGDKTKRIDMSGKIMTPGFIEGHGHLMGIGYSEMILDLSDVESFEALVDRVAAAVAKSKPGEWIIGRGWHQDKWKSSKVDYIKGFPRHHALSEVSPDNPVFLRHVSGHASMANLKAMQIAGVTLLSKESRIRAIDSCGEIIKDEAGNPTGIFSECATNLIEKFLPDQDDETPTRALQLALAACAKNGITSFHDAGITRQHLDVYTQFRNENRLTTRLYVMLTGYDRAWLQEWFSKGPLLDPWLTVRSIKLNCDGALGPRGAWLLAPYSDRPDYSGTPTLSMDTVLKTARDGLRYGFQVCSHAIGDRANREILDRYETAFKEFPTVRDHRYRIEHAQHIDPSDLSRFATLGVLASMQPIHMASDRPWAIERLGKERIESGAYMWQSLLQSGAKIINGTDAPVEPLNPIACFYAAVTRKTLAGIPDGGYEPKERMTREQALRSYTLDAAYGSFEESIKGSIEVGKLADFTIFDKDIMTISEDDILSAKVVMTVVDGNVVYENK
jgi:predicted amidohydrolase YtcJ